MFYKTNFFNLRNKSSRLRFSQLTPKQRQELHQAMQNHYFLHLYNELTTVHTPTVTEIFRNPPPCLLHLSGYGEDFITCMKKSPDIFHNICDKPHISNAQPMIQLLSDFNNHNYKRHAYLANDYFNPNFSAVLRSELSPSVNTFEVILDTGCSFAMTFDPTDFISEPVYDNWGSVQTASESLPLTALGTIQWAVQDTNGKDFVMTMPGFLVPGSNVRLLSPQDYVRYHKLPTNCDQYGGNASSFWMNLQDKQSTVSATVVPGGNLPILYASQVQTSNKHQHCHCKNTATAYTTSSQDIGNVFELDNHNLTSTQKLLMLHHCRLGHLNFQHLQSLFKIKTNVTDGSDEQGELINSQPCLISKIPSVATCSPPLCRSCLISKAKRRKAPGKLTSTDDSVSDVLRREDLMPGDKISMDQYQSSTKGRLEFTKGKERDSQQYVGGTIFVDHASGLIFTSHQPTLGSSDTIRSVAKLEQFFSEHDVKLKRFHTDNGVFTTNEFKQHLTDNEYQLTLSGVGAHHQNGIAERAIQTVVWKARTMMIHLQIHWPEHFQANLWTFALNYATWLHNHTPTHDLGFAPIELFSGTRLHCHDLRRTRVFGCPTYVLDPRLQDGFKIPKWEPRARLGQFLGFSSSHSTTIGLIRNLRTGFISPQYHTVFDEKFLSVSSARPSILESQEFWSDLFLNHRDHYLEDNTDLSTIPTLHPDWLTIDEINAMAPSAPPIAQIQPVPIPQPVLVNAEPNEQIEEVFNDPIVPRQLFPTDDDVEDNVNQQETDNVPTNPNENQNKPNDRPRRERNKNPKYFSDQWINVGSCFRNRSTVPSLLLSEPAAFLIKLELDKYYIPIEEKYTSLLHRIDPYTDEDVHGEMGFFTQMNNSDFPTLREILNMQDKDEQELWYQAMDDELNALFDKNTFIKVDRSVATSKNAEIVGTTWVFRRKRKPDGTVTKLKARLVVRGDQQKTVGRTVDETYAPVVEWSTVRLLLTLAVTRNLCTTQIDFKNAFVQSTLPEPIYVELPPGGYGNHPENKGQVLEVHKSLYGDRRAPKLWYIHLRTKLEEIGFNVDKNDACLFVKPGCIFVTYVDDGIFIAEDQSVIDQVLKDLDTQGLDFEEMGSLMDYLGVHVGPSKTSEHSIELTQPDLTNRLIEVLGLTNAKIASTPAEGPLGMCTNDEEASGLFNYRSVIGMAMFLCNNTRMDCAMAVHQCARFTSNPKRTHEIALKRIGRYLLGTADRGLIIRPTKQMNLDCYVDADFCGVFNMEDGHDPRSVRSRTGFVITLGDVPVLWKSKLQPQIALSTMESEYIALSTAMRSLLPLKEILFSMAAALNIEINENSQISKVWEDNHAAEILATTNPPRLTPRSKHIAIRYHWFREQLKPGKIEIKAIPTNQQKADILTKALSKQKHEEIRKLNMGW